VSQSVVDRVRLRLHGVGRFQDATGSARFERDLSCRDRGRRFAQDRFTISVSGVAVPARTALVVRIDGTRVDTVEVDDHGDAHLTRRGEQLSPIMRLERNDLVTVSLPSGEQVLSTHN